MLYYIPALVISCLLFALAAVAVTNRSIIRAGVAALGLFFLALSFLATPTTELPKAEAAENLGDARFRDFFQRYSRLLGAPISSATQLNGVLVQWFQFARVELKPSSVNPDSDFKNLSLANLGEEASHRNPSFQPLVNAVKPPIMEAYFEGQAKYAPTKYILDEKDAEVFRTIDQFQSRYERDSWGTPLLGSSLGPKVVYRALPAQWTEFGRIEWHPEFDRPLSPDFPKLELGRVGAEYMERHRLTVDRQPQAAPIVALYLARQASSGLDILYMFGNALTHPIQDTNSGMTTQFYERAGFRWTTGSNDPSDVYRLPLGRELFEDNSNGSVEYSQARVREQFVQYFYGSPITEAVTDDKELTTQFYQKAAFRWPANSTTPSAVEQLPISSHLLKALQGTPDAWGNPLRGITFGLSLAILIASGALSGLMNEREGRSLSL